MTFNHFHKKKVLGDRGLESRKGRCDFKKFKGFLKKGKNLQTNYPKKKKPEEKESEAKHSSNRLQRPFLNYSRSYGFAFSGSFKLMSFNEIQGTWVHRWPECFL